MSNHSYNLRIPHVNIINLAKTRRQSLNTSYSFQKYHSGPMTNHVVADQMKAYEAEFEKLLNPLRPTVVRLDGKNFRTFTSVFHRPFDERLHIAMRRTTQDLLRFCPQATTAYTGSDEISLVFPAGATNMLYNGRSGKLIALLAAHCSVCFNRHLGHVICSPEEFDLHAHQKSMNALPNDEDRICEVKVKPKVVIDYPAPLEKCSTGSFPPCNIVDLPVTPDVRRRGSEVGAIFDARCFQPQNAGEVLDYLIWRAKGDISRNAKFLVARHYMTPKSMLGISAINLIHHVKNLHGVDFDSLPAWIRLGTTVKRCQIPSKGYNPITKQEIDTLRTIIEPRHWEYSERDLMNGWMLFSPTWDTECPHDWSLNSIYGVIPEVS